MIKFKAALAVKEINNLCRKLASKANAKKGRNSQLVKLFSILSVSNYRHRSIG